MQDEQRVRQAGWWWPRGLLGACARYVGAVVKQLASIVRAAVLLVAQGVRTRTQSFASERQERALYSLSLSPASLASSVARSTPACMQQHLIAPISLPHPPNLRTSPAITLLPSHQSLHITFTPSPIQSVVSQAHPSPRSLSSINHHRPHPRLPVPRHTVL